MSEYQETKQEQTAADKIYIAHPFVEDDTCIQHNHEQQLSPDRQLCRSPSPICVNALNISVRNSGTTSRKSQGCHFDRTDDDDAVTFKNTNHCKAQFLPLLDLEERRTGTHGIYQKIVKKENEHQKADNQQADDNLMQPPSYLPLLPLF